MVHLRKYNEAYIEEFTKKYTSQEILSRIQEEVKLNNKWKEFNDATLEDTKYAYEYTFDDQYKLHLLVRSGRYDSYTFLLYVYDIKNDNYILVDNIEHNYNKVYSHVYCTSILDWCVKIGTRQLEYCYKCNQLTEERMEDVFMELIDMSSVPQIYMGYATLDFPTSKWDREISYMVTYSGIFHWVLVIESDNVSSEEFENQFNYCKKRLENKYKVVLYNRWEEFAGLKSNDNIAIIDITEK